MVERGSLENFNPIGSGPSLRSAQLREQRLRGEDPYAAVYSEWQQVLAIAGDEDLDACLHRAGKDQVVVRVAGHGLDRTWRHRSRLYRQANEQCLDLFPAVRVERELLPKYALELLHDGLRQHQLQATVNSLLDDPGRWAGRDKRRNQHVGVGSYAQDSALLGTQLVYQRFGILWTDPSLLGPLAPVALKGGEPLHLHLTAQGVADDLALGLAQALREGVRFLGEVLRQRDREQAAHMKSSYHANRDGNQEWLSRDDRRMARQ